MREEKVHLGHGFDSMVHAAEFAEHRNRQQLPGFIGSNNPGRRFWLFVTERPAMIIVLPGPSSSTT
jgi:hypothetical protein